MSLKLLYALLTLGLAGLAFWMSARLHHEIGRSRDWPTAPGKITEHGAGQSVGRGANSVEPRVKYEYTVDGKAYVGDRFYSTTAHVGVMPGSLEKLFADLPDPVPVHYNPENPAESYLQSASSSLVWIAGAAGVFALLFGLGQLLIVVTKSDVVPPAP